MRCRGISDVLPSFEDTSCDTLALQVVASADPRQWTDQSLQAQTFASGNSGGVFCAHALTSEGREFSRCA
jgi:hypothetical protein